MLYVGMDIHRDSTVCDLFDPEVEAKRQHRTMTVPTTREGLESVLVPLHRQCRVAYEVGTQAQWVASIVRPLALEVQVANPSRIPWLFRDGKKNDRLDARKLATLLYLKQLPTVHLPAIDVSAWRALINHRRGLVNRRTALKNRIRAIIRTFGQRCPHRSCWTRQGMDWLLSLTFDDVRDLMMKMLLADLHNISEQIDQVEVHLDGIAANHPQVTLLQTIPGIGPRTAEAVVAFADQIDRFGRGKQFASYFGMTPTLDASANYSRYGHISKRGPSVVRWLLVEAIHRVIWRCPPMQAWFNRVWRGKKDRYKKALVAAGRKLLTIMFAMLRDHRAFDVEQASQLAA
jgi:transposase